MNKFIIGSAIFLLVTHSDGERKNPIDGISWSGISEVVIQKKLSMTEKLKLRADRIVIEAPLFTEGYPLEIQARELVFKEAGVIKGFEKQQPALKPQKPPRPQAEKGLNCPGNLIRTDFYIKFKSLSRKISETDFNRWRPFLASLGLRSSATNVYAMSLTEDFSRWAPTLGTAVVDLLNLRYKENLKNTSPNNRGPSLSPSEVADLAAYDVVVHYLFSGMNVKSLSDLRSNGSIVAELVVVEKASERIKGRPGVQGEVGYQGYDGRQNPGSIQIYAEVIRGNLHIEGVGQKGGRGGKGQNGQQGGIGGKGCKADSGWLDTGINSSDNTPGGQGGRGGDGGPGGRGGAGGDPIEVKLAYEIAASLKDVNKKIEDPSAGWTVISQMGEGGDAGESGEIGFGGPGGQEGDTTNTWVPWDSEIGKDYGTANAGANGNKWSPTDQERANLQGASDLSRTNLKRITLEKNILSAKQNLIDGLFKLQFERSLWTLFIRSLDFALGLEGDANGARSYVETGALLPSLADTNTLRILANVWDAYLTWIENEKLELQKKGSLSADENLEKFLRVSREIGIIFSDLQRFPQSNVPENLVEKIQDSTSVLETRISNLADDLSVLCTNYKAQNLPKEFVLFRIPFCTDQEWTRNPSAVFELAKSFDPESPELSEIKISRSKIEDDQLIPQKFKDLFQLSRLTPSAAFAADSRNSPIFVILGDEDYKMFTQSVAGVHGYFENTSVREKKLIRKISPIQRTEIKNLAALRAMLAALSMQRIKLSEEGAGR